MEGRKKDITLMAGQPLAFAESIYAHPPLSSTLRRAFCLRTFYSL